MRIILLGVLALCAAGAADRSFRAQFVPGKLSTADGALLLATDSDFIDPYFSNKALLVADDAGLDIREAAQQWMRWLLPRQRDDGSFDRFCRKAESNDWQACKPADADDSMLALWAQLLYRMGTRNGMPVQWRASADRALHGLQKLRNHRLGVYYVSHSDHAALLMDNAEVYSALKDVAGAQAQLGDSEASAKTDKQAEELGRAIRKIFWDGKHHWFRASIFKERPQFYPDVLGQTYPLMAGLPSPDGNARGDWERWRQSFASAWLSNRYDPYSWGLIAVTAMKMGDDATAACWLQHARGQRGDDKWNVLEEASFQAVQSRVANTAPGADCARWSR
jgi:hypothetical protein